VTRFYRIFIAEPAMDNRSIDALAVRLDRLERENRFWRMGGGLALIGLLLGVIGGAQRANDPKVIEADGFVVRDKDGRERIRMGLASDGASPVLFLRGKDGSNRAILQAGDTDDHGSFVLCGERGDMTVVLEGGSKASNQPALVLRRGDERRINLNINTVSGQPWLRMQDQEGVLFQLPEPIVKQLVHP
jgi:hypothetical protein